MAIKEYREAVRLDPDYVPARTNLGVAYQEQGRLEMAIPQYREAIKLNSSDAVAHANLACALAEQGKMQAALLEYQEALRLNPRDAEVHFALGGLYENKNRPDLAMKEYRRPRSSRIAIWRRPTRPSAGCCSIGVTGKRPWSVSIRPFVLIRRMRGPIWGSPSAMQVEAKCNWRLRTTRRPSSTSRTRRKKRNHE